MRASVCFGVKVLSGHGYPHCASERKVSKNNKKMYIKSTIISRVCSAAHDSRTGGEGREGKGDCGIRGY